MDTTANTPAAPPSNGAAPAAPAPAPAKARPNPIGSLAKRDIVSGVERDFSRVLSILGWDPSEPDVLSGGDILPAPVAGDIANGTRGKNGKNVLRLSGEIFTACEGAWGKRPGADSHDAAWEGFMAAVARVTAQARRAHLLVGTNGVVHDSPEEAAKRAAAEGGGASRARRAKLPELIRAGTLFGEPWPAASAAALVAALGGRLPGRDALAAGLTSCGYVLVPVEGGIIRIEDPKPRVMSKDQTERLEKADTLDRKAGGLVADAPEAAEACRRAAAALRSAVQAELDAMGPPDMGPPDSWREGPVSGSKGELENTAPLGGTATLSAPGAGDFGRYLATEALRGLPDLRELAQAVRKAIPEGSKSRPTSKEIKNAGPEEVQRMVVAAYTALDEAARVELIANVFNVDVLGAEGEVVIRNDFTEWLAANPAAA